MAIVRPCSHPGCRTLTMGDLCIEHESSSGLTRVLENRYEALEAEIEALTRVRRETEPDPAS